jgi:hypothetical protein
MFCARAGLDWGPNWPTRAVSNFGGVLLSLSGPLSLTHGKEQAHWMPESMLPMAYTARGRGQHHRGVSPAARADAFQRKPLLLTQDARPRAGGGEGQKSAVGLHYPALTQRGMPPKL